MKAIAFIAACGLGGALVLFYLLGWFWLRFVDTPLPRCPVCREEAVVSPPSGPECLACGARPSRRAYDGIVRLR